MYKVTYCQKPFLVAKKDPITRLTWIKWTFLSWTGLHWTGAMAPRRLPPAPRLSCPQPEIRKVSAIAPLTGENCSEKKFKLISDQRYFINFLIKGGLKVQDPHLEHQRDQSL